MLSEAIGDCSERVITNIHLFNITKAKNAKNRIKAFDIMYGNVFPRAAELGILQLLPDETYKFKIDHNQLRKELASINPFWEPQCTE